MHKPAIKRTKSCLLKPTFTRPFKVEAVNENSFKVNVNEKLHSYNRANLKKGMCFFLVAATLNKICVYQKFDRSLIQKV